MIDYILIVILLMIGATTAVHLGLPQAIAKVTTKIANCHKCFTFWSTLCVLLLLNCNLIDAVLLSLFGTYLSNWFALVLVELTKEYNRLCQELNKRRPQK